MRSCGRSGSAPWSSTPRRRCSCASRSRSKARAASVGASAEMLVPKWFDKRAHLSPDQTVDELRRSLSDRARSLSGRIPVSRPRSACTPRCLAAQLEACAREDIPPLAAAYGPAEIDKAILDALLRSAGVNFFDGMIGNIAGIDARLSPDLHDSDIAQFLAGRKRLERVAIRHTVGLDDRVEGEGGVADPKENTGARYFKLKLNGDPDADAARLTRIGNELATLAHDYRVTLDANEQYADLTALGRPGRSPRPRQRLEADRGKTALYRAADAARYHAAIAARRARAAISSSTRPTISMTRSRRRARLAIAASPRNPARASTSRSSTRPARRSGARRARNSSSPAKT